MVGDPRIENLVARTEALTRDGVSVDEIVAQLRDEGFSLVESIAGLIRGGGLTGEQAREAVIESPVWADVRETIEMQRWVEPRNPPAPESLGRLRAVCASDPRILEVWFTGRRMTRADGSVRERDGVAVVLDQPVQRPEDDISDLQVGLMEKLSAAAPEVDIGTWYFTAHRVSADVSEHARLIYRSGFDTTELGSASLPDAGTRQR